MSNQVVLSLATLENTQTLAQVLADGAFPGMVILLNGDLGAGKTTLSQYFAKALQVEERVKSPTYTLVKQYESGRLPIYHFDVYRLENIGGDGLGLEEYFELDGVCLIEWSEFIKDILPKHYLDITLKRCDNSDDKRKAIIRFVGDEYQTVFDNLKNG